MYKNDKLCPMVKAAGMDFQILQITVVCTVRSWVQQLGGASFVSYELLLEKLNKTQGCGKDELQKHV